MPAPRKTEWYSPPSRSSTARRAFSWRRRTWRTISRGSTAHLPPSSPLSPGGRGVGGEGEGRENTPPPPPPPPRGGGGGGGGGGGRTREHPLTPSPSPPRGEGSKAPAGERRPRPHLLLDAEQLVVLGQPLAAGDAAHLDLPRARGDGEVG